MKRTVYLLLATLLLLGLALGCTTGGGSGSGVLNLYDIDPHTLDPAVSGDMTSHQYIMQIFSGLVRLDSSLDVVPDIARSWQLSEDGRTYTFYLRDDVRFHDGRQVKAADFKYSWERAVSPGTSSLTAATYLGDIVGVGDVLAGKTSDISGVKVLDDFTLQVTIDAPKSYFLAKLNYPTAFVVDRANVETGEEWWRTPNGTGPFKFNKWDENSLFVLERNDLYYGEKPRVEEVVFHLWSGVPMNLYETGQIDVAGIGTGYVDRVTDPAGPFAGELMVTPELSLAYIGFNHQKPPFDDVNVRRAFSQAIDRDKLITLVFRGMVQRADGIVPPGMPDYVSKAMGQPFDPAGARELIKRSRYGDVSNLPPITITTSGWGGLISGSLEAIINEWRQNLGVEVKVRQIEPERYLYFLKEEKDEMFDMGWVADYAHPQDFLDVLFHSGADNNSGEYSNREVDALLERANLELNAAASTDLYQQAEQMLIDDVACIPLWFGRNYTLVKPYIKGYSMNAMGFASLNTLSVEPQ